MTAGFALFGAEGGSEAVDAAETHGGGLEVELAGLGEVERAAEVVDFEEGGLIFADDGGEDRGVEGLWRDGRRGSRGRGHRGMAAPTWTPVLVLVGDDCAGCSCLPGRGRPVGRIDRTGR